MRSGWSLDPEDWNRLRAEVAALDWNRVAFESLFRDSVAELPGVYAICAQANSTPNAGITGVLYNALYVGQTKQRGGLRGRFMQHLSSRNRHLQLARRCFVKTEFWWAHAPPDQLSHLEAALMGALGPAVNKIRAPLVGVLQPPQPA